MKEHQMATMKGETLVKTAEKVSENEDLFAPLFLVNSFLGQILMTREAILKINI